MPAAFDTCTCGHSYVHHSGAAGACFCACPAFKENGASLARRGLFKCIVEHLDGAPALPYLARWHGHNGAPHNAAAATPEEAFALALHMWRTTTNTKP